MRYRGNLVKQIKKDEKRYYEELVDYSRRNLMLFPYHLSDVVVKVCTFRMKESKTNLVLHFYF